MSEALRLAVSSNALADEGAMIHLCSWVEIRNLLRANAAELRRLAAESEMRRLALQDEMQKNKRLTEEFEALKRAISEAEPVYAYRLLPTTRA